MKLQDQLVNDVHALGLQEIEELQAAPATVLNAVAAGKLTACEARERLDNLFAAGEMQPSAHGATVALLSEHF